MKTYKIHFRHYDKVLTVKAHHFSTENDAVTFYTDETEVNRDIYVALDAVGAIEAQDETPVTSSPSYSVGGSRSDKLRGF